METENSVNYTYKGRSFGDLSVNDDSFAFSDCNSDRSGEFTAASSSQGRRLLLACASENSDDLIRQLVLDLESLSIDEQKQAAMELRLLAKNKPENRIKIAKSGAIKPLIALISSSDPQLQENGVTAILNLSLCDENKELIASAGAIKPLVRALKKGTSTAKENAACALLRLSQTEENKEAIGRSGAIQHLVNLLENGGVRGKKDALTALYSLCSVKDNKIRAVEAGIMKPLVELMADFGSNMVDKSAYVLSILVSVSKAKTALPGWVLLLRAQTPAGLTSSKPFPEAAAPPTNWDFTLARCIYYYLIPVLQFATAIFFADTWQYFYHRLVHVVPWLYTNLHSVHHKNFVPYAFGAFYSNMLEAFLVDVVSTYFALSIARLTTRQAIWFVTLSVLKAVDDHSGYAIPWDPFQLATGQTALFHDIHHQGWGIKTNFTQTYTTFWDHALGTVWKGSEKDLAQRYARGEDVGKQWMKERGRFVEKQKKG